jgi:hypothetical protein
VRRARLVAIGLAVIAVAVWVFVLASGGVVRRPPRKLDRAAAPTPASAATTGAERKGTATGDARAPERRASDPRSRLDGLEQRLGELLVPLPAARFAGLDALACAWSRSSADGGLGGGDPAADDEFEAWRRTHALAGTHVHGSLRIAILGTQVVREGDQIDGARVARIDPGSVEIDWMGTSRQLELAPDRASDAGGGDR